MLQLIVTMAVYMALVIPMGVYLYHVAAGHRTFADPVFNRIDNGIYKLCRIDRAGMDWKKYPESFDDQWGDDICGLPDLPPSGHSFPESKRDRGDGAHPGLQYDHQLHDEHESPALFR